ncbi:hypothetical protein [Variovorax paradoxus]|uniref:hypothetical protein n=1 Tax=Variovorax paradoxus TaxID=34073 RepID=UPI0029C6D6F4|nr:hypothetical protein RZE77_11795 [Variovorax paradoxus]
MLDSAQLSEQRGSHARRVWLGLDHTVDGAMQSAVALHGLDGDLAGDDGPTHGHGSIVNAALGAAFVVEKGIEYR